ncbi:MAG: hypothetical protein AM325_003440 [Candidatus Thorarchaeota archaeon SMTZ1-45]|nr:MAG: hypothetical protein AM325_05215 [Candidatus Thorarchaeota archaeon SMTZ1-45]
MGTSRDPHAKENVITPIKNSSSNFESITKKFLSSPQSNQIKCPTCGDLIDFNSGVTWQGPDTFTCCGCARLLSMRLIQRALKDLGVDW